MSIDTVVLGASGYVGGELLRLIDGHPEFRLAAAVSASHHGEAISQVFPHLGVAYSGCRFSNTDNWVDNIDIGASLALFSAAAHGTSSALVRSALELATRRELNVHVVDTSADFRFASAQQFEAVYDTEHMAPSLLNEFLCGVPEHNAGTSASHAGHPGCFATAILLAAVPLVRSGLVSGDLYVGGITGSSGAGSRPQSGTHHPSRHSNVYAYKPLSHRHVPEVEALIGKSCGTRAKVNFVPHSGPFSRGIYVTLQAAVNSSATQEKVAEVFRAYYHGAPFVQFVDGVPRLKDVVASNQCHLGASVHDGTVVVMCAIDNLVKGAAGGAMQWMNRLWSLPETAGLMSAPPAWI